MGKNTMKTFVLMAALGGAFVLLGAYIGGTNGMIIALAFAGLLNLGTYWFSDKMVLKMTRSKPVSREQAPWLYEIVRPLASVGCYVPGGRAVYPSSVCMTVVPAMVAGVDEIVVCTPPRGDGSISPSVLYAARRASTTGA